MWFEEAVWGDFSNWISPPTQRSNRSQTTNFFSFQSMMPNWTAVMTPCRESLSSYLQAVDINFPLRDKQNLLYASCCLDVMLSCICTVNLCLSKWGRFGFHLFCSPQEFSALELHIKECNRRLCTHTWLTVTRTDVGSDYKGSHYNRCYEYYMS